MNAYILLFLFLEKILLINSVIPRWNMTSVSIDLLSSNPSYELTILSGANVQLKKVITKTENIISSKNYLTINTKTIEVDFDNIGFFMIIHMESDIFYVQKENFILLILIIINQLYLKIS